MVSAAAGRALVAAGTVIACALTVQTVLNVRRLRRPQPRSAEVPDNVAVLIPARDEADTIEATIESVLAQAGVPHLRAVVLDDGSADGTAERVPNDPRVVVIDGAGTPLPRGWLGKPWACARLADAVPGASVLVFVDADVELAPDAIRSLVDLLRREGLALAAPFPRQLALTWPERLVQPLVTWLWAATLPLGWAESSQRPSLSAANGQLMAFDAAAYRAIGGHAAVRDAVLEDVAIMRAMRRAGYRAATVDGSALASCRMYDGFDEIVAGYGKSLWSAFSHPLGSAAVCVLAVLTYVVPPLGAIAARRRSTRSIGAIGYGAGVVSRALVAQRTGERVWPDAALHPLSMITFVVLIAESWRQVTSGTAQWKGRAVRAAT